VSRSGSPLGGSHPGAVVVGLSVLALAVLCVLLYWRPAHAPTRPGDTKGSASSPGPAALMLYCAAGLRAPIAAVAKQYQQEYGVEVQLQYGGSNVLLSQAEVSRQGDLYLAAEESYTQLARQKGLLDEVFPIAYMRPVLAVRPGNPKGLRRVSDLLRDDVRVALADPDAAAVGKVVRGLLQASGFWAQLEPQVRRSGVFKPTVNDVANDVKLGAVDAAFVWDTTVAMVSGLEAVTLPELAGAREQVTLGVLRSSRQPSAALRFARYLTARDRGLETLRRTGFRDTIAGDAWEERPTLTLFSGGVNRLAIQETLTEFARREDAEVNTVYNGCGILVAQMKGLRKGESRGAFPDAYFACDVSFMRQVREWFTDEAVFTQTQMVILAPKGNPRNLRAPADLAQAGLKVGLANPDESALGHLCRELFKEMGVYEAIQKNVATQTPTADLLVNQMKIGALDAAVVYEVNTVPVRGTLEIIRIEHPKALARQPYAVARETPRRQLVLRLLERLRSPESRRRYEAAGFQLCNPAEAP
jgi:molybdate transport system substrate-binding protein